MNLHVLVTGCAGFIGWRVTELLLSEGHMVLGIDNLNNAYDTRLKRWRLAELQSRPNFTYHHLDCADRSAVKCLLDSGPSTHEIGAVINLAAKAGVRQSLENPWEYYETNVIGTLNVLELCREKGIGKFVLASSSSVYGDGHRPSAEDGPTEHPSSPYAASKKAAEALSYTYHHLYGLDVSVLRYFTVYGPAGRPDMAVFRFLKWIVGGEPVIVFGDGSQERDFTYVEDIAVGTVAALKPLGYEIINLGSDRPESLMAMITLIEGLVGKKAEIEFRGANSADVNATWASNAKAKRLLGWSPGTSLEEGLARAAEWYRQNHEWAKEIRI